MSKDGPVITRGAKWGIFFLAVWAGFGYFQANARIDRVNETLTCFVQASLDRSQAGLPRNAYFKEHPKELQDQLDIIEKQRAQAIKAWGVCDSPTSLEGDNP